MTPGFVIIRVGIRVRGLHLVFLQGLGQLDPILAAEIDRVLWLVQIRPIPIFPNPKFLRPTFRWQAKPACGVAGCGGPQC